ncbi:Glycosyltransferase AglD [Geodia barretti]|uniref:dolichyl-phosphate beta-glucosyltransferase n=1 Tax=Geodia barretti TaxID=519541 RepID=A0AA35WYL5_GEOBA|nr:Glycosyltransferase AglD [Geodia barretti]
MSASIDIVIPVYNEEDALPVSIPKLCSFLRNNLAIPWRVTIADNASIDGTRAVSEELSREAEGVNYLYLPEKGRGRALRAAWLGSECDYVSYMDVDLSTDLSHFPALVGKLESGWHVAIGSRLSRGSNVTQRSFKRELTSRTYNKLIWSLFFVGFPDAQCGFKAMTRQAAQAIIPQVKNNNWFFDTELLIIAEKRGYRIGVVPVAWEDDPSSTVNVVKTATEDIKGLLRLRFGGIPRVDPPPP